MLSQPDLFDALAEPDRRPTLPGYVHGIVGVGEGERGRRVYDFQCDGCGGIETSWAILTGTLFYRCAKGRRICEPCHEASDCWRKETCRWW